MIMYQKAFGLIETLAPLHVGASSGEESGNVNLVFRDQFTKTGIIPGSSIRGRFRANMRSQSPESTSDWYGQNSDAKDGTTEAQVKFEYGSLVWLPVFCPGQPIVWVTCPQLLKRYGQIKNIKASIPEPYTASVKLRARDVGGNRKILFFNLGFLEIKNQTEDLAKYWLPSRTSIRKSQLVVVDDNDIAMIHDMALYRQSRVALEENQKKARTGAFFNVEALPEGSVLIFPIAMKKSGWKPFGANKNSAELYFGGLESIGFGRCNVTIEVLVDEPETPDDQSKEIDSEPQIQSINEETRNNEELARSKWESYGLDRKAQALVLNAKIRDDSSLNQAFKMREALSYGLERFWGEHLRLQGKEQKKSDYWKETWDTLVATMGYSGIEIPNETITNNNTVAVKNMAESLWALDLEVQRVTLAVLTQLCDCLVWWTQRYK